MSWYFGNPVFKNPGIYISKMSCMRLTSRWLNYIDNLHEDLLGAVEFVSFLGSLACIIAGVFSA